MLYKQQPISISVLCGTLLGLFLAGLLSAILPWVEPGKPYPFWSHFLANAGQAIASVAPGFCAGFLARRAGPWVGATTGLTVQIAMVSFSSILSWPIIIETQEIAVFTLSNLFIECFSSAISNGTAGLAGEYLGKNAQLSNIAVKRDAPQAARPLP